jgi:hypothetical protein
MKFRITWFHFDPHKSDRTASMTADGYDEAGYLIQFGPRGWRRYRITRGNLFVERGDPDGPRGNRRVLCDDGVLRWEFDNDRSERAHRQDRAYSAREA